MGGINKNKKVKIGNINFYIFWIILLIGKGMGYTSLDQEFWILSFFSIPFALGRLFLTRWYPKEIIRLIVMNLIGIAILISSRTEYAFLSIVVITLCKDIDLGHLFKMTLWIKGSMFVVRTTLAMLGKLEGSVGYRYYESGSFTVRYGLGYGHPNTTHYTLFIIIILAIIVYYKRMKLYHYIMLFVYNLFIFHYTNSRAGVIMTSFCIVLCYIVCNKGNKKIRRMIGWAGQYVSIACTVFSFIIAFLFANSLWLQSFGTLSSRFMTGADVLKRYQISLFGTQDVVTDFGYIGVLYGSGVVFFLLYIAGMCILGNKMKKKDMYLESTVLILYSVYMLVEAYSASINMNISLFYMAWLIYPKYETSWMKYKAEPVRYGRYKSKLRI